ncbi:hypothetical protein GCM10023084_53030 [Streptomyces lacrimifluminis]|uniref:Uncharacterized protein n=1 Tax=Streptomyces lacrimifluminis TaxID=1500077 RepID=A0A917LCJ7_9ACTN|nr:hypothetical protein GCM10012282_60150 [Streptomyces lacrimifluminis]
MREEQQEDAGAEGERGGERAERAGQYLGDGVHPAVPEAREDSRGDVDQTHERTGPGDDGGDGLGTRTAQYAPYSACSSRNLARHFPIYPDRHRIP